MITRIKPILSLNWSSAWPQITRGIGIDNNIDSGISKSIAKGNGNNIGIDTGSGIGNDKGNGNSNEVMVTMVLVLELVKGIIR